jgi:hypothetical protein
MPPQMEDSPWSQASEKLCGLVSGNGMIVAEQAQPARCLTGYGKAWFLFNAPLQYYAWK